MAKKAKAKPKTKAKTKKKVVKKKTATKKKAKKTSTASKKKSSTVKKAAAVAPVKKNRTASKPRNSRTLSYTQSEFVENIRTFCGLQKRSEAKEICEDISAFIKDSLKKGYKIPLMGLGKMYVRKTKARMGRNPATGETIKIPAKKRVRFTVAKALKDAVL